MQYELRSLGLGELLDTSFRLLRQHFTLWLAVLGCCLLPTLLTTFGAELALGMPLSVATNEVVEGGALEGQLPTLISLIGIHVVAVFVCLTIACAAITAAVATLYRGETPSFEGALHAGLRLALPLLGTQLLILFLFAAAGLAALLPMALLALLPVVGIVVFVLGLLAFGTYAYIPLILLAPVAVLEKKFFLAGWSRCWQLMAGYRSRAWGILLAASLIYFVVAIPLYLMVNLPWIGNFASLIEQMVSGAYLSLLSVVLYFDLRCRKEGYDLEQLTEAVTAAESAEAVRS